MYPFKGEFQDNQLQKLQSPQLLLQSTINIESLKKYLIKKLDLTTMGLDDISILYKNQNLKNEYTLKDIERIFGAFSNEKIVFHYSKAIYATLSVTPKETTEVKKIEEDGENSNNIPTINNASSIKNEQEN